MTNEEKRILELENKGMTHSDAIGVLMAEQEKEKTKEKTCKEKVQGAFESRMEDIKTLYNAENQETKELGSLNDYGLSIDKVEAGTFEGQRADYIRYQISYDGPSEELRYQISYDGPSEEFRIYKNGDVEFWYMDWFDGAKIDVLRKNADIIKDIVSFNDIIFFHIN